MAEKSTRQIEAASFAAAQKQLNTYQKKKGELASREIQAVLHKHGCVMAPRIVILGGNIVEATVAIIHDPKNAPEAPEAIP